jgi:hypothetical protein
MKIKIEKGIPAPPPRGGHGELATNLRKMEVGDSILLPLTINQGSLAARMCEIGRSLGRKFTRRKTSKGHRVWRID